jgi:hypothetical protein
LSLHPDVAIEDVCQSDAARADRACFFGYFALSPWSPDGRYFLFHRRASEQSATVEVCLRDTTAGAVRVLGESHAWNFQQGSLAQWLTDDGRASVVFNDVAQCELGCRLIGLTGTQRWLRWPIQAVHPGGSQALSINYRRLSRVAADYGYRVECRNLSPDMPPDRDGIWRIDLGSDTGELIVTLAELAAHAPRPDMAGAAHEVNHLAYSPAGTRFVFMHRWVGARGRRSRLWCMETVGGAPRLVWDERMVSHYAWQDEHSLLLWAHTAEHGDRYYLLDVVSGRREIVGRDVLDRLGDGHPSFSPDRRWIVTDSYPDRNRHRRLLLWHCAERRVVEIASCFAPWRYQGTTRCDLHPRWSPDGRSVSIDSAHEGIRRSYVIDVSRIVSQ